MPTSIDPQPADDEIECARCGAYFYLELTRCPNCGVNIFEPDDFDEAEYSESEPSSFPGKGALSTITDLIRSLLPGFQRDKSTELSVEKNELYADLLIRVGGDRDIADRLVAFERRRSPRGNTTTWLKEAIRRWQRDNR